MAKRQRRRKSQCAYCGKYREITRDHVIPRNLFPRPLPKFLVTVPACDECNSRKSLHDDFLRDLLVSDAATSEHPVAQQIFHQKVLSSHRKGKSLLSRIVVEQATKAAVVTKSGLYLGDCYLARFDFDRSIEMFSFIVRGLYFRLRKVILPVDCKVEVRRLGGEDARAWWEFFEENQYNGPYSLGDGVFWCAYNYATANEAITFWMLSFYERVFYRIVTTPVDFKWEADNADADLSGE